MAEPPPTYQSLQALLQRGKTPYSEDIRVTVEVQGIYALPDEWTSKIVSVTEFINMFVFQDDPAEQAFTYEVKALGANLKGAKMNAKEEEEGSKADDGNLSAKDPKKAAPPKGK